MNRPAGIGQDRKVKEMKAKVKVKVMMAMMERKVRANIKNRSKKDNNSYI
jgi:hypothetical protein